MIHEMNHADVQSGALTKPFSDDRTETCDSRSKNCKAPHVCIP